MHYSFCRTGICCLLISISPWLLPTIGHTELLPHHIAILSNADSADSLAVARHYARQRDIPSTHIIHLPLPDREYLSRDEYDRLVVMPVRQALKKADLASTIRVLVTTYGVPLRVAAPTLSSEETRWLSEARSYVRKSRTALEDLRQEVERLATGSSKPTPSAGGTDQDVLELARTTAFLSRLHQTMRSAAEQLQRSSVPVSPQTTQRLARLMERYGGWSLLLENKPSSKDPPDILAARTLLEQVRPLWAELGRAPITDRRPLIYRWAERLFGLRGVLELASAEVDLLTSAHADASLDSELSLLWWDRELASAAWRQPNPLFAGGTMPPLPVLMVSRLDGPTVDTAKRLVDLALRAERDSLHGTVYLDARGLTPTTPADTYGHYDQSLRHAADLVRQTSDFRVILENTEKTFAHRGEAPDVALYIGWYRLQNYEDAFTFNPGAIGYHMASAEALSVHDRGERGWCKNALERGITATLGSVAEPYLDAFPEPADFLRLLLAGRYSLAEVYYLSSRYLSWRMVLFGDPLYNPLGGRGRRPLNSTDQLPIAPSDRSFADPTTESRRLRGDRSSRLTRLVSILVDADAADLPARR
jgi:uncharacterized protein (TIGR03790 family)